MSMISSSNANMGELAKSDNMKNTEMIETLRLFIADKIQARRDEVLTIYATPEEQERQIEELRVLSQQAQQTKALFNYAKWYSANNEIIVLEKVLQKVKEIERTTIQRDYEVKRK